MADENSGTDQPPLKHGVPGTPNGESFDARAFFRNQYAGLRALLIRRTQDPLLAADLLDEAISTAMDHLRTGRATRPDDLAGYIFQIAINLLRNHRRKLDNRYDRRVDAMALDRLAGPEAPVDEQPDGRLLQKVRELIESLPTPRDREVVKRFYLDEETKEVICQDLGLSMLHFDKVVFRARQRLKTLLEARGFKPGDFFSVLAACLVT
jgi:RNA polymerase sigma-70 factor (ECF subfamily)